MLWTIRALISEFQCAVDEWDLVLPLAEFDINHRPREALGGRCPMEVTTGRTPRREMDLVVWGGETLEEADRHEITVAEVDAYCGQLAESLRESEHNGSRRSRLMSRALCQLTLPIKVLISPLCARHRNGCAKGHFGLVLVEKRLW